MNQFKEWAIIVAIGNQNEIGKDNQLLWHISDDLRRFKRLTTGHTIVMGRKTFDSLPKGALPNRRNIVITRQTDLEIPNAEVYHSYSELYKNIKEDEKVFVIGGASLYKDFADKVNYFFLTQVDASLDADVYYPEINWEEWEEIEKESVPKNEKNEFDHQFFALKRKNRD